MIELFCTISSAPNIIITREGNSKKQKESPSPVYLQICDAAHFCQECACIPVLKPCHMSHS